MVSVERRQWTTDCSLLCQQAWRARLVKRDGCEWLRHAENGGMALAGDGGHVTHAWVPGLALHDTLEGKDLGQLPQLWQMLDRPPLSS